MSFIVDILPPIYLTSKYKQQTVYPEINTNPTQLAVHVRKNFDYSVQLRKINTVMSTFLLRNVPTYSKLLNNLRDSRSLLIDKNVSGKK